MPRSQNAIFRGTAETDREFEHPAGASVARLLISQLPAYGWGIADFDNWRDCGWLLPCSRGDQSLDLVIAPYESSDSWMLQIAASRFPSFILRWFGAVPSAEPDTIFQLSHDAHSLLCSSGFADFKWFWDGLPDAALATSTPQPAISVW